MPKRIALIVAVALIATFFVADGRREAAPRPVAYSELLSAIDRNEVTEVRIAEHELVATLAVPRRGEPLRIAATRLPGIDESQLVTRLEQHNVKFYGATPATFPTFLPLALLGGACLLAAAWLWKSRLRPHRTQLPHERSYPMAVPSPPRRPHKSASA